MFWRCVYLKYIDLSQPTICVIHVLLSLDQVSPLSPAPALYHWRCNNLYKKVPSDVNPRLTGVEGFSLPSSLFRDISRSYQRTICKLSVPSRISIWHVLIREKEENCDGSAANKARLTLCAPVLTKIEFSGNTQTALKTQSTGFQPKMGNMPANQTAFPDFQNLGKNKTEKCNQKTILKKNGD